jgi:Protein of unknown function (DUF3606)
MTAETNAADDPGSEVYIDMSDSEAVERWCKALAVTDEALWKAVQEVGTRIDKIKDFLGAGGAGEQVDG